MSKQDKDRATVERITERFVRANRQTGHQATREQVREAVVKQMIRRDLQGKNK